MAEFAAWGAEAAPNRLITQDLFKNALMGSQIAENLAQAATYPAHAELYRAQAQKMQREAQQEALMQEIIKRVNTPEQLAGPPEPGHTEVRQAPLSPSAQIDRAASAMMGAGLVEHATKLYSAGALIDAREEAARTRVTQQALNQMKLYRDSADLTARFFGGATDQASLDLASTLYEQQMGQPSPYRGATYSPELVRGINNRSMSADQRFRETERLAEDAARDRRHQQDLDQRKRANDIREQAEQRRREEAERKARAGGSNRATPAPTEAQQREVNAYLRKTLPDLSAADRDLAAKDIAAEARARISRNQGLNWATAYQQAFNEGLGKGDFPQNPGISVGGFQVPTTGGRRYVRGRTPETAMQIPMTMLGKVDKSSLVEGRYYIDKAGNVIQNKNGRPVIVRRAGE